jgi:hypothetical protein
MPRQNPLGMGPADPFAERDGKQDGAARKIHKDRPVSARFQGETRDRCPEMGPALL